MADPSGNFSFFQNIHITNGQYLYLHKTWDHQNQTAGSSKEVDSLETNQTATGDIITSRSHEFKTRYNSL